VARQIDGAANRLAISIVVASLIAGSSLLISIWKSGKYGKDSGGDLSLLVHAGCARTAFKNFAAMSPLEERVAILRNYRMIPSRPSSRLF
jgi:hypothetical protein